MKILFLHHGWFSLAHGGYSVQIEETKRALENLGHEVEWLRAWDEQQTADIVHAWSPVDPLLIRDIREKGMPVVLTTLLTNECNWPESALRKKAWKIGLLEKIPGFQGIASQLPWRKFPEASLNIVGLECEKHVLETVYGIPAKKIAVVPLGTDDVFLNAEPSPRTGDHLISVGTITERKGTVELARLAKSAEVPILFVGKPYSESDPYWKEFASLIDGKWIRHQPHVSDKREMVKLYQAARGFVINSQIENWCLVAHEAAACDLPLLLPEKNWSRERFPDASFFKGVNENALMDFYRYLNPRRNHAQAELPNWISVSSHLEKVYKLLLEE